MGKHTSFVHIRLLPRVEGPHQDTERVDVGPGGDLGQAGAVAVVTCMWGAAAVESRHVQGGRQ